MKKNKIVNKIGILVLAVMLSLDYSRISRESG